MVKLTESKYFPQATFYFHNMKDCQKFMAVFEDHWCGVPWDDPIEVSKKQVDLDDEDYTEMDRSPKKRAEEELDWGFALCKTHNIGLTDKQSKKLGQLMQDLCIR